MTFPPDSISFRSQLVDGCIIQNRTVDTSGKVDNETWTPQAKPSPCRTIQTVNKRRTSPDNAEKVQYGTFIFLTVVLPKTAVIAPHDRIVYPVTGGKTYDVIGVVTARDGVGPHHIVASCDVRG